MSDRRRLGDGKVMDADRAAALYAPHYLITTLTVISINIFERVPNSTGMYGVWCAPRPGESVANIGVRMLGVRLAVLTALE
jgi:hypothetical protein